MIRTHSAIVLLFSALYLAPFDQTDAAPPKAENVGKIGRLNFSSESDGTDYKPLLRHFEIAAGMAEVSR